MFWTFVEDRIRLAPAQGVGTIPVVDIPSMESLKGLY